MPTHGHGCIEISGCVADTCLTVTRAPPGANLFQMQREPNCAAKLGEYTKTHTNSKASQASAVSVRTSPHCSHSFSIPQKEPSTHLGSWLPLRRCLFCVFLGVAQLALYGWLFSFSVHRLSILLHLWVLPLLHSRAGSYGWACCTESFTVHV